MSGFKGTPGTWEVHQEDGEISIRQAGTTESGPGWSSYTQIATELNNIHDANLIAAAPKLLEALHQLTREYIRTRCQLNDDDAEEMENVTCVIAARKAINEVLGE